MRHALAVGLSILLLASAGWAADEGETIVQAKDTLIAIDKARKAQDVEALETAFSRLVELHNGMEGADWRKKLRGAAGSVLDGRLTVATGEGALRLLIVQRAGKPAMDAAALLRGRPIPAGTRLA